MRRYLGVLVMNIREQGCLFYTCVRRRGLQQVENVGMVSFGKNIQEANVMTIGKIM